MNGWRPRLLLFAFCTLVALGSSLAQDVSPRRSPQELATVFSDNAIHLDRRIVAIEEFVGWGKAATPQVATLAKTLLEATSSDVRSAAAMALGALGPVDCSVVPALTEALTTPHPTVRLRSAEAFHWPEIAAVGRRAVGNLARMVWRDPHAENRAAARQALVAIDSDAPIVVRLLRRGLRAPEAFDKRPFIDMAVQLEARQGRVVRVLAAIASEGRGGNRFAAIEALGFLGRGQPDAEDALRSCLLGSGRAVRLSCLDAVLQWGAGAVAFSDAIESLLGDPDTSVREAAALAMEQIVGASR